MSKKRRVVLGLGIVIALVLVGLIVWLVFSRYRMDILKVWYEKYEEKYITDEKSDLSILYEKVDDHIMIMDYAESEDYIVACGARYTYDDDNAVYPWLAMFGADKKIIWEINTDNGVNQEVFAGVSVEGNAIYALSGRKFGVDYKLAITKVDMNGEVLDYRVTEAGCEAIGCTEKLGDSYFISTYSNDNKEKVVKVEGDDSVTTILVNDSEYRYVVQDMMVYNNKLYISCYEVPEGEYIGNHEEYSSINEELMDKKNYKGSIGEIYFDRKQMEILRDNYTAYLFAWDEEAGACTNVYTEKQAVGTELYKNEDGQLVWKVQKFDKGLYSLGTSSFSVETINSIHEFVFDESEKLLSKNKMDKCVYFRR